MKNLQKMREIITTLQRISNGEKFFFNMTQYKNMGLITVKNKWATNPVGNKIVIGHTFHLTAIGKQFVNLVL